jgi:co-chaperonin GroES (HSP10)
MLKVAGHKVLIKHMMFKERMEDFVPKDLKDKGFEIAASAEQERREEVASEVGTVVGVGPTAWYAFDRYNKDGSINSDWTPWCKLGDQILFARYAGKIVEDPITSERFMIINDEDVQAVVTGYKDPFEGE